MANVRTTYQDAFCVDPEKDCLPEDLPHNRPLSQHPTGGECPCKAKKERVCGAKEKLPPCDEAFFRLVNAAVDLGRRKAKGRYCIESTWRDPRLVNAIRAANAPVYEPLQRDPPNCGNWYVYRSTLVDPLTTPCQYLTVPDVHKLRYLKGNHNTAEDWFD